MYQATYHIKSVISTTTISAVLLPLCTSLVPSLTHAAVPLYCIKFKGEIWFKRTCIAANLLVLRLNNYCCFQFHTCSARFKKHQNQQRPGLCPGPHWGAYNAPQSPDPIAGLAAYFLEPHTASVLRVSLLQFWTQTDAHVVRLDKQFFGRCQNIFLDKAGSVPCRKIGLYTYEYIYKIVKGIDNCEIVPTTLLTHSNYIHSLFTRYVQLRAKR